jgi:HAE1 family hydrophobic/amphiphilic exporter-1
VIERALRRPVSVIVASIAFSVLGLFSLAKLPVSLLPAIDRPALRITARARLSQDEMLHEVTEPIERRLHATPDVTSVESTTRPGECRITVVAGWQSDPDLLRIEVARRLEGSVAVPFDELSVESSTSDAAPVAEVAVTGGVSGDVRTRFARDVLLPELARIDGCGRIDIVGSTPLRLTVEPSAAALVAHGLTAADVASRLRDAGKTYAAGRVREGASVRPLVIAQPVRTAGDLAALTIETQERAVPLGEVALVQAREVSDGTIFRSWSGGAWHDGVLLLVNRAPRGNAVRLATEVRRRVASVTAAASTPVNVQVVTDRSSEVRHALGELVAAALLGILLGTVVLRYFLGGWQPTFALTVVIPIALTASFSIFYALDVPLDVISLAGLALATGLLVDNSIVVLEAIENARAEHPDDAELAGTRTIAVAVISSSATLLVVFAPLLYLHGLARAIFGEQAVAVTASIGASLLLALTLTPVLARSARSAAGRNPGLAQYLGLVERIGANRRKAIVIASVVTLAGITAGALVPRELFPAAPSHEIVCDLEMSPQLTIASAADTVRQIGDALMSAGTTAQVQGATVRFAASEGRGEAVVSLRTREGALKTIAPLQRALQTVPGLIASVRLRPSAFLESVSGNADRVELVVSAPTDGRVAALATRIERAARDRRLTPVPSIVTADRPDVTVQWDLLRLAQAGSRRTAEDDAAAALGDFDVGEATGRSTTAIRLLPAQPRDVALAPIRLGEAVVPLAAVARLRDHLTRSADSHDDGRPARHLVFRGSAADWRPIPVGAGEQVRLAGHAAELQAANADFVLVAFIAVVLLYATVAAFYESLLLPLVVMLAVPFAAAGAMLGLLLSGQSLNVMSMIGLLFLSGIVVNHTVVLLDRVESLRRDGIPEREALRRAMSDRFRPVIMTTVTAILAMLPLAVIGGDGVELRRPIAIVVIAGLIAATCGTLLLVPLLHEAADKYRRRKPRRA